MKKTTQVRKLVLNRESLHQLEARQLTAAHGNSDLCTGPTCLNTCTHNTRFGTCTC